MAHHATPEHHLQPTIPSVHWGYGRVDDRASTTDVPGDALHTSVPLVSEPQLETGHTHPETIDQVQIVRNGLRGLGGTPKRTLEEYIRQFYVGEYPIGRHGSYVDWLADEDGATPEEVLTWDDRQSFELQVQQHDAEVQAKIISARGYTAAKYAEYQNRGWFAQVGFKPNPVDAIRRTQVLVGDVRQTMIWNLAGYHLEGSDHVVVGQGHRGSTEERMAILHRKVDETVPHELLHAAGLGSFAPRWAMEGIVEHATDAFAHGEMHVLYPDHRRTASRVYLAERKLLGVLQLFGAKEIDTGVVTRALSSAGYDSPEFKALDDQLYESWKVRGKFQQIGERISSVEQELAQQYPHWSRHRVETEAAKKVHVELVDEGVAIRQRLHQVGKVAARSHRAPRRTAGVHRVPAQRRRP